jgi:kynurenine formamidase
MANLNALANDLVSGAVQVVDLTAPLHSNTPILVLPEPFGQTASFKLEEISKYDDRGPAWYWNNFHTGEHTGTHLDAPNHWITGKDGDDVASIPPQRLVGPAVVLDFVKEAAANPDFLLEVSHIEAWEKVNGEIPKGAWVLFLSLIHI